MSINTIKDIDFELYRGDDTVYTLICTDNEANPIDFNGAELSMLIKPKSADNTSYLMRIHDGIEVTGNRVRIIFSHKLTAQWDFRKAVYDLQMIDSQGLYKTLAKGYIYVTQDITP